MHKTKLIIYFLIVIFAVSFVFNGYQLSTNLSLSSQNNDLNKQVEMPMFLTAAQLAISAELEKLDSELQIACQRLSNIQLDNAEARTVISNLVAKNSLVLNAAIHVNDVLVAVEPSGYSYIEGRYVGDQEQCIEMRRTLRPAMSDVISLVEGTDGAVMIAPVFDTEGSYVGAVSLVFKPSVLVNRTIAPIINGFDYTYMAIQLDGRVIYDADSAQIGVMTLTDPVFQEFPQLLSICRRMATEEYGYGTYQFNTSLASDTVIKKECYWTTIGVYDTEWRLAIIHRLI